MKMARLVALSLLPWLDPAMAQSVPDFSGRWVAIEPAAVAGHELRISQDDAVITLEQVRVDSGQAYDNLGRRVGDPKGEQESTTYRLDGKPTITARSAGDVQQVRSTLRWEERNRVVLMDLYQATGLRFERSLTLDPQGRLVLVHRYPAATSDEPARSSERVLARAFR